MNDLRDGFIEFLIDGGEAYSAVLMGIVALITLVVYRYAGRRTGYIFGGVVCLVIILADATYTYR